MYDNFLQSGGKHYDPSDIYGYYCFVDHMDFEIEKALESQNIEYRRHTIKYDLFKEEEFFLEPTSDYDELSHKAARFSYQHEIRYILHNNHRKDKFLLKYSPLENQLGGLSLIHILPGSKGAEDDPLRLLLTLSYINKDGVVAKLLEIPESYFNINSVDEDGQPIGQVEIIGWMYQYYNSELKDQT